MDESILISIRPKWCELIASGKKTIEIRKTRPKLETPFKCYIYCTIGKSGEDAPVVPIPGSNAEQFRIIQEGRVIGEFICDYTQKIYFDSDVRYGIDFPNDYGKWLMKESGLTLWEMKDYLNGKDGVYWHISALKIYTEPKKLTAFHRPCQEGLYCESCAMHSYHSAAHCGNYALKIRRPPQSWMYAEE